MPRRPRQHVPGGFYHVTLCETLGAIYTSTTKIGCDSSSCVVRGKEQKKQKGLPISQFQ